VKHRDLAGWDTDTSIGKEMMDMMISNASLAGFQDADGNAWSYCYPGAVDYVLECTKRVVDEYFRDQGENWDDQLLDGVPLVKIYGKGQSDAFEKLTLATDYEDRTVAVPDDMNELELSWLEWQAMKDADMIDMDYQDWMKTYGSHVRPEEQRVDLHRPEDISHYGNLAIRLTQWSRRLAFRRPLLAGVSPRAWISLNFFKEPGWLIGYNTVRPKVYLGNQQGALAGLMQTRATWLPAVLNNQQDVSHVLVDDLAGPLAATMAVDYWVDLKDLLNYGDQFVNYATPASGNTGVPFVELPLSTGVRRYAASTEIMALFADTTNGRFRQDGICSLSIMGRQAPPNNNLVLGTG